MSDSSENDVDQLITSSSSRKRRCTKQLRLSSDSDENPNSRVSKGKGQSPNKKMGRKSNSKDAAKNLDSGRHVGSPEKVFQTPRSSERLRQRKSFSLPSRDKTLEEISPGGEGLRSQQKVKLLKPRKLVNNFLRERSSYVSRGERTVSSDDSGMSDFINDDDDCDDDNEEESSMESDNSTNKLKDSGVCVQKDGKKRKGKKRVVSSSDEHKDDPSSDGSDDIALPKTFNKKSANGTKTSRIIGSSSDSDESFGKRRMHAKKSKVIECSESNSDEENQRLNHERQENANNNGYNSDTCKSEGIDETKKPTFKDKSNRLRPRSSRLEKLTRKQNEKNQKKLHTLLKQRQEAKLDPKERIAKKHSSKGGEDNDSDSSDISNSDDDEPNSFQEAAACFGQNSSELEEDEDDRNFIVCDGETSDEGLNSDGATQFLKLLDTFTCKPKEEDTCSSGPKDTQQVTNDFVLTGRRRRRKKRKERQASQWRRIKMEDDSEENEASDTASVLITNNRHPLLHAAIQENDLGSVKKFLDEDPDSVYEIGYRKRTALHLAALKGDENLVKLLLKYGADRTALDSYHLPAIAYALDGHPECVKLLLDRSSLKHVSNSMKDYSQEMNLLHFAVGESRTGVDCHDRATCLELLFSKDKKTCTKLLEDRDVRGVTPLVASVYSGQHKCAEVLLKMGANALAFRTADGGNILHFAVESASHLRGLWEPGKDTSQALGVLLQSTGTRLLIDQADNSGFTPLMYACESGNAECVSALLENGASLKCVDSHGTSSLHLASMSGDTECVQLLLNHGHQVDCVDRYGWPPLLYANFKAHESCVLALMKPKPEQVFVLGDLLRRARNEIEKRRTVRVVKNVLVSLANHDAYYTVFNDFIRKNPEMLDDHNYGLLQHTWRAILDFDNKRRWFVKKLAELKLVRSWMQASIALEVDRENVLGSTMEKMGRTLGHALRGASLRVTFKDEPGTCTGPKREFFACLCKDILDPKQGLFVVTDDSQYSPVPNAYFAKHMEAVKQPDSQCVSQVQTASQGVISANQNQQETEECSDDDLLLALSQTESHSATAETSHGASNGSTSLDRQSENQSASATLTVGYAEGDLLTGQMADVDRQSQNQLVFEEQGEDGTQVSHSVGQTDADSQLLHEAEPNTEVGEEMQLGESNNICDDIVGDSNNGLNNSAHGNLTETPEPQKWISCKEQKTKDQSVVNLSLRRKLKQLRFVGRMIGFAVCQDMLLNLHLSKPFVKQTLGIPLSHPDDLSSFDYELHKNAVIWVQGNSVDELDLPFSVDALNPWNLKPVTIELSDETGRKLTDKNKDEYVKLVSQFKLETSVKEEAAEFSGGLHEVIPGELLSLFTADEFSLLIGGVARIDVEDWKKHAVYNSCSFEHDVIQWFWNVVSQLKEEEKALLMKFSTGSPCVPLGGFASLTGLGGPTKFTIMKIPGVDKIPMASTCFNMLKLTSYSSEKQLREKLLIAIRHGAEGFSFA